MCLFGVQLGGGTDIAQAIGYCQRLVTRPADTVLVLVSDLYEGGNAGLLHQRVAALRQAGVSVLVLLALSDEGAPAYDHAQAAALAELGVPSLACTPDAFPELLAAALERRDVGRWANEHGLHTAVPRGWPMIIRDATDADIQRCNDVWVSTQSGLGDRPDPVSTAVGP